MSMVQFHKASGEEVGAESLLRLEVVRARHMMARMLRKLGSQGMADLFADEIAANAAAEAQWISESKGRFVESVAMTQVAGGNAREFIDWFVANYSGPNGPAMLRAHPEHLGALPQPDGRVAVLEVPGHTSTPALLHLRVLRDASQLSVPVDPGMPHRIMGRAESAGGELMGFLLHQFADTSPGFKGRLAIYWPARTPEELVQGHALHLMVEFNNWFLMYLQTRSSRVDLMPVALACGAQQP